MKTGLCILALSALAGCSSLTQVQPGNRSQNLAAVLAISDAPGGLELALSTKDAALLERVSTIFERYQLHPLRSVSETIYYSDTWSFDSKRTPMFVTIPAGTKQTSYRITTEMHQNLSKETVQKIVHEFSAAVESCDACQVTVRMD